MPTRRSPRSTPRSDSVLSQLPTGTQQPTLTVRVGQTHRRDVYRLQQHGAGAEPDHRLPGSRGAAEAAGGARRADRRNPRRQEFRPARLARSGEAGGLWPDRGRRVAGAGGEQLHLGPRQHQGPDGAGEPDRVHRPAFAGRVPRSGGQAVGRRDRPAEGRRQRLTGLRRLRNRGRLQRQAGGLYRHPGRAGGQPAGRDPRRARHFSRSSSRNCRRA